MVAHTEPVNSWGQKPCGEFALRPPPVSRRGAARRARPGTGAANPRYKRSFSVLPTAPTGAGAFTGLAERKAHNEQRPSQAAAPSALSLAMDPSYEGDYCGGAGNRFRDVFDSRARLNDDLGKATL